MYYGGSITAKESPCPDVRGKVNSNTLLIKREEERKKGREAVWEESGSIALGHNDRGIQDRHGRERQ
jgi:hypothetical protein